VGFWQASSRLIRLRPAHPALTAPGPSFEINPLLNVALNKAWSIGENLSFPVSNYSRSYTIGLNYLVGTSELPPR
jgi:hypothetical protein